MSDPICKYQELLDRGIGPVPASILTLAYTIDKASTADASGYDVKQAAKYLGVSVEQVRKEYIAGRINYYRSGRKYLFTQHDLEAYRRANCANHLSCSSERENRILRLAQT